MSKFILIIWNNLANIREAFAGVYHVSSDADYYYIDIVTLNADFKADKKNLSKDISYVCKDYRKALNEKKAILNA